ncbi:MAG TPA: hypothetical protein VGX72_08875 [Solirubrobacteraceae bacterium]|nr:hypothetical protein [Solirubrobacteraceae bacterium]
MATPARARLSAVVGLVVLLLSFLAGAGTARAGTPFVDGISDQSLPVWNGSFTTSAFVSSFRTSWVGQIAFARYVLQWNAMAEASAGANAHGDYRERFEAWLEDVRALGLEPVVALTSYTGVYPDAGGEYQQRVEALLGAADRYDAPVGYVEAWNEPNNQGNEPAAKAGEIANWANAVCTHLGCQVIAGDFEDSPSLVVYQQAYITALQFSPVIWGIHPYRSVKAHNDEAIVHFEQALPDRGAGAQIWFTEVGAYYCAHRQVLGEAQQAADASYLIDTLIPTVAPTHAFYYGFMAGDDAEVPCATGAGEDSELYRASGVPRAAASVIFAGFDRPLELAAGLSGGLAPFD